LLLGEEEEAERGREREEGEECHERKSGDCGVLRDEVQSNNIKYFHILLTTQKKTQIHVQKEIKD